MAWSWVRPTDPTLLSGRPLLDLGCGDGQTLSALTEPDGLRVGVDRSLEALRGARRMAVPLLGAEAAALPFASATFAVVLAADLFHHVDDESLGRALREIRRVLRPGGRLVAWWYHSPGRGGPGSPAHPRRREEVEGAAVSAGFAAVSALELSASLEPLPPTTGLVAEAGS